MGRHGPTDVHCFALQSQRCQANRWFRFIIPIDQQGPAKQCRFSINSPHSRSSSIHSASQVPSVIDSPYRNSHFNPQSHQGLPRPLGGRRQRRGSLIHPGFPRVHALPRRTQTGSSLHFSPGRAASPSFVELRRAGRGRRGFDFVRRGPARYGERALPPQAVARPRTR